MPANKTFVVLATPSFERRPVLEYIVSLSRTQSMLLGQGIDYIVSLLGGDPYLGKVRNRLAATMLNEHPTATHLFFIDDDIGWPAEKVIEFLERPEDIICGIYPKKQDKFSLPVSLQLRDGKLVHNGPFTLIDGKPQLNGALFEARLVPTGFMCIKRHVLEKMAARAMKYHEDVPSGKTNTFWEIFQARLVDLKMEELRRSDLDTLSREDAIMYLKRAVGQTVSPDMGQWWGEDFYFAERWREMGGTVWVDPDIHFTHSGFKAWEANFWNSVKMTIEAGAGVTEYKP